MNLGAWARHGALLLGVSWTGACPGADVTSTTSDEAASTAGNDTTANAATTHEAVTTDAPTAPTDTGGDATSSPASGTSAATDTAATETAATTEPGTTGPPPVQLVPVFLAQGHYGRTTISCDDGLTWILDTSKDDAARCFTDGLDCDHDAFAGRGIAHGLDVFVLTWGWGKPGTVERTDDALEYLTVMADTKTFADIAFGNGRFVAGGNPTWFSDDGGLTWEKGGPLGFKINYRAIEFVPHDGGVFIVTGHSGDAQEIVRSPDGVTWAPASVRPTGCGALVGGVAYGTGVTLLTSNEGFVCRSLDGGDTWARIDIAASLNSVPVWTGEEFYVYGGKMLHRSPDGESWQSEPIVGDVSVRSLARSPGGTFVAVNSSYENQRFYRSTDGKTWDTLPDGAYKGGHPMRFIAHGAVAANEACP